MTSSITLGKIHQVNSGNARISQTQLAEQVLWFKILSGQKLFKSPAKFNKSDIQGVAILFEFENVQPSFSNLILRREPLGLIQNICICWLSLFFVVTERCTCTKIYPVGDPGSVDSYQIGARKTAKYSAKMRYNT